MWGYIIDGVLIALIIIFAIIGIVKGFFDSVLGLISTGLSLTIAVYVSKYVSNWINKMFNLEGTILDKLNGANDGTCKFFGGKFVLSNEEVAKFCVWVITILVVFLIIRLIILILAKIFAGVVKASPTISGLNRLFGMLFGTIKGVVVVVCLIAVSSLLAQVPVIGTTIYNKISETKITSWAYKYVDEFVENNLTEDKVKDIVSRITSKTEENTPETPETPAPEESNAA